MNPFVVYVETRLGFIDRLLVLAPNPAVAQLIARAPHTRAARILVALPSTNTHQPRTTA